MDSSKKIPGLADTFFGETTRDKNGELTPNTKTRFHNIAEVTLAEEKIDKYLSTMLPRIKEAIQRTRQSLSISPLSENLNIQKALEEAEIRSEAERKKAEELKDYYYRVRHSYMLPTPHTHLNSVTSRINQLIAEATQAAQESLNAQQKLNETIQEESRLL